MKSRTLTARLRELFSIRWLRPAITAHEAGQAMARRAADVRQRAAGLVGGKRPA